MRRSYHLLVIAIPLLSLACKNNPVDSNPPVVHIIPMKVGNSWTYAQTNYDTLGNITSSGEFKFLVAKDSLIAGKTFFAVFRDTLVASSYYHGYFSGLPWRVNTDSGLVKIKDLLPNGPYLILEYKYPALTNDFFIRDDLGAKVIATNVSVQVPAGTFNCIKYEFSYGLRLFEVYIQPGLGEIKSVAYFGYNPFSKKDSVSSTTALKSYILN